MKKAPLSPFAAAARIAAGRVSQARGWPIHDTIFNLLEQGLFVCEAEVRGGFDDREVNVLAEAISALKDVPPGKGF